MLNCWNTIFRALMIAFLVLIVHDARFIYFTSLQQLNSKNGNFLGKTQQVQTTNKIADSFPGMDGYVQAPVPHQTLEPVSFDMKKPPKWLKRPVGASFGVS